MARRKSGLKRTAVIFVVGLAIFGAWTLWQKKETQKTVEKVERSVKAAHKAW